MLTKLLTIIYVLIEKCGYWNCTKFSLKYFSQVRNLSKGTIQNTENNYLGIDLVLDDKFCKLPYGPIIMNFSPARIVCKSSYFIPWIKFRRRLNYPPSVIYILWIQLLGENQMYFDWTFCEIFLLNLLH